MFKLELLINVLCNIIKLQKNLTSKYVHNEIAKAYEKLKVILIKLSEAL